MKAWTAAILFFPDMKSLCSFITVFFLLCWQVALAHHGKVVKFDTEQQIQLEGRITKVDWANPHVHLFVVEPASGDDWYVELESPVILEWNGWDALTVQPGDLVSISGYPARDGSPQIWGEQILHAGEPVFTGDLSALSLALHENQDRDTPRWPDGLPGLAQRQERRATGFPIPP